MRFLKYFFYFFFFLKTNQLRLKCFPVCSPLPISAARSHSANTNWIPTRVGFACFLPFSNFQFLRFRAFLLLFFQSFQKWRVVVENGCRSRTWWRRSAISRLKRERSAGSLAVVADLVTLISLGGKVVTLGDFMGGFRLGGGRPSVSLHSTITLVFKYVSYEVVELEARSTELLALSLIVVLQNQNPSLTPLFCFYSQ